MHKTTQSTDRSTSVSLSSGSTLRSRHHYSSKKRAKDATEVLNSLVEAASASPVRESPHRSPANDDTGDRCKQTMTSASPFFSPPQQRFVLAARKESDIDWDLTTTAGSPVRRVPRAGTISDDEELVNDVKPPFLHRQGSPVLSPDITRNLPSMATGNPYNKGHISDTESYYHKNRISSIINFSKNVSAEDLIFFGFFHSVTQKPEKNSENTVIPNLR